MIKFDKDKKRWVVYSGDVPLASSAMLVVLTRRFPDAPVDESGAE